MNKSRSEQLTFHPIGIIHSPHHSTAGMPIQPAGAQGIAGVIEVFPQYAPGLADLDGFSHIILLYAFHLVQESSLTVTPFLDTQPRGIFSTRAPKRPNPIGLSVVRLVSISGNTLQIENVDILNGTPLLDIKPSIPDFDHFPVTALGWYQHRRQTVDHARADNRFSEEY